MATVEPGKDAAGNAQTFPARLGYRTRARVMVVVCLLGISSGPAAFGLASIGMFIGILEDANGWSRTAISSAVSLMMACTALSLPVVGWLVDRYGVKRVVIPSVVALGLCLIAIPFATALWQFYAIYIAIGTIAAGSNSVGYMRVLATWFDRSRGLAIGIAGSGTGLGFAYVPLVTQFLIDRLGWQWGYYGLGLIMLCITMPMVLLVLRENPASDGGPVAAPAVDQGKTLPEAAKTRDFWLLMAAFVLVSIVLYGLLPHLVPLLTDRGLSPTEAAAMASAFGLATFGGRILIGFLIDHFDARRVAFVFFTLSAIGLPLLSMDLGPAGYLAVALLLGGSLGAEVDMLAYLTSRYFGLRRFAQIFGLLFGVVMMAMGVGPMLFGAMFDGANSYQPMLALGAPLCGLAALLTFALHPYAERRRGGPVSTT